MKKEKIIEVPLPLKNLPDSYVVNGAFKVSMKDQFNRPTCVAFAGIKAVEILLAQNGIEKDLSEQYLYWAGKPDCQKKTCSKKGSWITAAFNHSLKQSRIDIPLENSCVYQTDSVDSNETQIPLSQSCFDGQAKVTHFEEVRTLSDVVEKLKKDIPVVMAAKLSENFYRNDGLVTLAEAQSHGKKLDLHALGHAFLAIGVMELPEKLKVTEGAYCILVANSWGKGWGAGGYSCLSQKWLEKYRQPSPFIALTKLSIP